MFQSPRSGKFESNLVAVQPDLTLSTVSFQSPRSGKFESNLKFTTFKDRGDLLFQSPRSGKFESNTRRLIMKLGFVTFKVSIP